MTTEEAVAILDSMQSGDPEAAHSAADDLILALVNPAVAQAYARLVSRCGWWATA